MKIQSLDVSMFRGIPNTIHVDFQQNGQPISTIIYGDNGSGKSSIVDAIELVTQGTIQGGRTGTKDDWIYNSISLKSDDSSQISINLSDETTHNVKIRFVDEKDRIAIMGTVIQEFINAPYVLRRRSILNFWETPNIKKLTLFFKYVGTIKAATSLSKTEIEKQLSLQREQLKQKKRDLLKSLGDYFGFDSEVLAKQSQSQIFAELKKANKNRSITTLPQKHPKYNDAKELVSVFNEIADTSAKLKKTKNRDNGKKEWRDSLSDQMKTIAPLITEAFKKISRTNDYVKEIDISVAETNEVSMGFSVVLENGKRIEPTMLFSEANRDLLALLIYLEFIYNSGETFGQARVLVLDDVFQSVDATIRFRIMQYIIERFSEWQVIITTHDRLWKEQIVQLFRNHSLPLKQLEIVQWTFNDGPIIIGGKNSFDEKVQAAVENGSASDICAAAGYLLEYMCDKLSVILNTSIRRKRGDKYTIGDLWPGIYKELKKSTEITLFAELNDLVYLRNMVGSHYNEWSLSLSRTEAKDFALVVLQAYYHVYNKDTGRWIQSVSEIRENW